MDGVKAGLSVYGVQEDMQQLQTSLAGVRSDKVQVELRLQAVQAVMANMRAAPAPAQPVRFIGLPGHVTYPRRPARQAAVASVCACAAGA